MVIDITLLSTSVLLCYLGYSFIFKMFWNNPGMGVARTEKYWGVSLGVSDIIAASITVPIFISGLIIQREFLPRWICYFAGFVANLYIISFINCKEVKNKVR